MDAVNEIYEKIYTPDKMTNSHFLIISIADSLKKCKTFLVRLAFIERTCSVSWTYAVTLHVLLHFKA
jgi:hypothetical protein